MASTMTSASLASAPKASPAPSAIAGRAAAAASPAGLPFLRTSSTSILRTSRSKAGLSIVRAAASSSEATGVAAFSKSIGLPTEEGILGFGPFAEQWNGRLAMMGFTVGLLEEVWTGNGILQQIGLPDGRDGATMGYIIAAVLATATVSASLSTVLRASGGRMSKAELVRWQSFLRLDDAAIERVAALKMKDDGDFTSLDNDSARIAQSREEMAADQVLSMTDDVTEAKMEASEIKAAGDFTSRDKKAELQAAELELKSKGLLAYSEAEARAAGAPEAVWVNFEPESLPVDNYGKQVELNNGRAAMLGFAAAVVVEGFTGSGIIPQIISIMKGVGLLGPLSGF